MSDAYQFPSDALAPESEQQAPAADTEVAGADGPNAQQQLEEQKEKYLRLAAEYDNYRRRTDKERRESHMRGQADMLKGLIDPLDDIGRFAHVDPATTDAQTLVDGVAMVEKKLAKTLAGHGLEVIVPDGQVFDPALHEAVMTEPAATPEEDHTVARTFQVGYVFNGQLLRPARVVVKQWNG